MVESVQTRHSRWQLRELLRRYPDLRIVPADELLVLLGALAFRVVGPDDEYIEDEYQVALFVPADFPEHLPAAKEYGGRIPESYHKLENDFLCLGAPTELRMKLKQSPSLVTYVEQFLIPYLYGYSVFAKMGKMPYGELLHGDDGIRQYLASLFQSTNRDRSEDFVLCAAMKKRRANKLPCPCGGGRRLGRCHNRIVNSLRERFGRKWFQKEYDRIIKTLKTHSAASDAVDAWLARVAVVHLPEIQPTSIQGIRS